MSRRGCKGFWRNENGATAALYALALPALVAVGGVGFDYARLAGMDSELQNAADQAALAGATQLDGKSDSMTRAISAAQGLIANATVLSNDGQTAAVDVPTATILFYETRADAEARVNGFTDSSRYEDARFIEVAAEERIARYAFTPVVATFSGAIEAMATAGLGSSVCKVPPIMICHPDPLGPAINWATMEGIGIVATGHNTGNSSGKGGEAGTGSAGNTWSPGNFGFLQVEDPDAKNKNAALLRALAYANPPIDCTPVGDNRVSTGNPQGLYDAVNTRFDIYDFNDTGGGNVLASCQGGSCPPAPNVVKDFQNDNTNFTANNSCKIHKNGWKLPDNEFNPVSGTGADPYYHDADDNGTVDAGGETVDAMGLPRDLCHYKTFSGTGFCGASEDSGRFGNGVWAKYDYFKKNHGMSTPPSGVNTRYQAYLWEIANGIPDTSPQRGTPVCYKGSTGVDPSRRVMTVAVVSNCAELNGTSKPVVVDEWLDVFLVEPSTDDAKRHNAYKDAIYFEVIGPSELAGDGTYASQQVRRDVPYLVR
jgi:Flp pilus assembly protein TadG